MIWLCMYKSRVSSSAAMKVKVVKVPDETIHYLQPQRFSSVFLLDVYLYVDRKCLCAAGADGGVRPSVL